ncbi:MAG: hypothetical protein JRJ84_06670 [Deltaproteobacteria bacterium]|nr:hypothetical protein [Deltaproteobacteria bacterium]
MTTELTRLLNRIREGIASEQECTRARELALGGDWLPEEIQPGLLERDLVADAVGLLAVLGEDVAFGEELAAAIDAETRGSRVDVVLDDGWAPVRSALARGLDEEAAGIDVSGAVLSALGLEEPDLPVADAVRAQAGEIDIVDEVTLFSSGMLAAAMREEAGTVDLVTDVMRQVRQTALAPASTPLPEPVNTRRWFLAALTMAAVFVLSVTVGRAVWNVGEPAPYVMQFASAEEIVVNDLSYGESTAVYVFQADSDNAPLIIWVDEYEEATL